MKSTPVVCTPLTATQRTAVLTAVIAPFLGALCLIYFHDLTRLNAVLFLGGYLFTGFGITIGLHRYFTHGGFKTSPLVEEILGIAGMMGFMGTIKEWVANHLIHHDHSDTPEDLHSPYFFRTQTFGALSGLAHSHIGWMLKTRVAGKEAHLPPRILDNKRIDAMDRFLPLWLVLSLAIPPAIGGIVTHSWHGALTAFLWGSAARIFFVHHVTWSINSICHIYGSQPFKTGDLSRNNPIFGILAFGEGWHNAHHAFLRSPKHGLLRWQIDPSWMLIKTAAWLGIVWDLALPSDQQIERALAR